MKGWGTGEARIATLRYFGRPTLVNLRSPDPEDLALIRQAWHLSRQILAAGEHDLVILDEIDLTLAFDLIPREEALEVLRRRPLWVEVVLTGRQPPRTH